MEQLAFDHIGKICTECKKWKPLDCFHKYPSGKYGYRPKCKSCRSVPKTPRQIDYQKLEKLGFRYCRQCKRLKPLERFHSHGNKKYKYYVCKNCMYPGRLRKQEQAQLFQEGKKRCNTCGDIKKLDKFRFRIDRQAYEFECKKCRNSRARKYNANNPEKVRARYKRWIAEKLAKDPEFFHKKYIKTRDKHSIRKHKYYSEHREHLRAYSRKYYRENKEKVLAYQKKYNAEHADQIQARKITRRTRKTEAGGSFTTKEWQALCEEHGNSCLCCGADDKPLTVDHIIPVSRGGSSNIENLQPLCKSCNCKKHDKIIDYRPCQ